MKIQINNEHKIIFLIIFLLVALNLTGLSGIANQFLLIRVGLGLMTMFFVSGYLFQAALLPKRNAVSLSERLILSFGLSIAIIPPLAVLINLSQWGMRYETVTIGYLFVILLLYFISLFRKYSLPKEERSRFDIAINPKRTWSGLTATSRKLGKLFIAATSIGLLTGIFIFTIPRSDQYFTEFFLLGQNGRAQEYPNQVLLGESINIVVGISNQEKIAGNYRVEIQQGETSLSQTGPYFLQKGQEIQDIIQFTPQSAGNNVEIRFLLFLDSGVSPYRQLSLYLNVIEPES
jgi:uncharacterized membrane protein